MNSNLAKLGCCLSLGFTLVIAIGCTGIPRTQVEGDAYLPVDHNNRFPLGSGALVFTKQEIEQKTWKENGSEAKRFLFWRRHLFGETQDLRIACYGSVDKATCIDMYLFNGASDAYTLLAHDDYPSLITDISFGSGPRDASIYVRRRAGGKVLGYSYILTAENVIARTISVFLFDSEDGLPHWRN